MSIFLRNISGEIDSENLSMVERLRRRQKLQVASEKLEKNKSSIYLKQHFDQIVKKYKNGAYKIRSDFISKLIHTAQWGDKNNKISSIIDTLEKSSHVEFYKAMHSLSSNLPPGDLVKGPVDGNIWNNNNRMENTMYNLLKKALIVSVRSNEHFINRIIRKIEKDKVDFIIAEKLKKINKEKLKKEQENKLNPINEVIDNWEDLEF